MTINKITELVLRLKQAQQGFEASVRDVPYMDAESQAHETMANEHLAKVISDLEAEADETRRRENSPRPKSQRPFFLTTDGECEWSRLRLLHPSLILSDGTQISLREWPAVDTNFLRTMLDQYQGVPE